MSVALDDATADAVDAAFAELTTPKEHYPVDSELILAGDFVARFGTLADLFEGPDLAKAQFWAPGQHTAAVNLLGHWSVNRGDEFAPDPDPEFPEHRDGCGACHYLEGILELRASFNLQACPTCGAGLDDHDLGPDENGTAHAFCRSGVWERREPFVCDAGDVVDVQLGDGYDTRWVARLSNGEFAVVTRTYYVVYFNGRIVVQRDTAYLVCTDPDHPGDTEVGSAGITVDWNFGGVSNLNLAAVTERAPMPQPGEWENNAPDWARNLL